MTRLGNASSKFLRSLKKINCNQKFLNVQVREELGKWFKDQKVKIKTKMAKETGNSLSAHICVPILSSQKEAYRISMCVYIFICIYIYRYRACSRHNTQMLPLKFWSFILNPDASYWRFLRHFFVCKTWRRQWYLCRRCLRKNPMANASPWSGSPCRLRLNWAVFFS